MKTIINLFEDSVKKYYDLIFLQDNKTGDYESLTYGQVHQKVLDLAAGLHAMGLRAGERAAILSEGQSDWLISELAILYCGAINVPLSTKLEADDELSFRLKHSGSKIIFVSSVQLIKIRKLIDQLPLIEHIIIFDSIKDLAFKEIRKEEVYVLGEEYLEKHPEIITETSSDVRPDDIANISYTSGTTADPKGILLSHRNYTSNVEQAASLMYLEPGARTLTILPWDHAFAHTACLYTFMYYGGTIASLQIGKNPTETLRNISKNIQQVKPHIMMSVPALAKNFRKNIENGIKAKGKLTSYLFRTGILLSYCYNGNGYDKGKGMKKWLKWSLNIYDKLIFSKVRAGFGGELRFFIGGGALLDIELQRFFYAIGIPMFQGYGLSEASPIISSNTDQKHKLGSSGFLVSPMELKIIDENGNELPNFQQGEIVIRGENVMKGYWQNEKATKETLKNGWLHTGDLGYMDQDGFLYVLGRFKSLLIGSDGEKYSPEGIEEAIVENSKYIDQIMLYNNQNPFTTALVVPNKDALKHFLKVHHLHPESEAGIKMALQQIQKEINRYKTNGEFGKLFPSRWIPTTIGILSEPFNEENKQLNSTMKMVRGKITEHYSIRINKLYDPESKNIATPENMASMAKILV